MPAYPNVPCTTFNSVPDAGANVAATSRPTRPRTRTPYRRAHCRIVTDYPRRRFPLRSMRTLGLSGLSGTDSCDFPWGYIQKYADEQIRILDELNLSPGDRALILAGNAVRLLNLDLPSISTTRQETA
ncbi:hypothetical protein [Nonomuraea sp. LPB2021202275-12-8]|uniref:hypothetical protein n=1 Tax=Nonomuraea sp. LPB2021202275-12-8 TaxID=3120159 RepID=UPI00300C9AD2